MKASTPSITCSGGPDSSIALYVVSCPGCFTLARAVLVVMVTVISMVLV
ncbi:MAG: hypothetical protein FD177_1024 [Desulfovibrionaceae bacterium]|nr:MAG: hypothetical protein FD177_1024 [Desulfovibrionaceae bacterium]